MANLETKWFSPESAPKTKVIIADFGNKIGVIALWDEAARGWSVPYPKAEMQSTDKRAVNVWWECVIHEDLRRWRPINYK